MKILFVTLKKTLFWSYERGSWQYDVMCVLILAFIFFAPNSIFHSHDANPNPRVITSEELGPVEPTSEQISKFLSQKDGHEVEVSSIKILADQDGKITYLVYEK